MIVSSGVVHRYQLTLQIRYPARRNVLSRVLAALEDVDAEVVSLESAMDSPDMVSSQVVVDVRDGVRGEAVIDRLQSMGDVEVLSLTDRVTKAHLGGKIEVRNRLPLASKAQLSVVYTPGVAQISSAIHADPDLAWSLTIKKNAVAVVTDGTAVLGLGDIGPRAAMPVMEGKAMLFKEFANVDAWPICLDTKDPDEIVRTVKALAPGFGGINLEDISAPRCFEIEERLKAELDIPVFHDDQHGTAVVVLAALMNALRIVEKPIESVRVCISGMGAAGIACGRILQSAGVGSIVGVNSRGIVHPGRDDLNPVVRAFAEATNPEGGAGSLRDALEGADVFLGVSAPNLLTAQDLRRMNRDPVVFALANPVPEIMPEDAMGIARIVATGRSDYPNQINNVLCFPGLFRGVLDVRAGEVNESMKLAAAEAIASCVSKDALQPEQIIPSVFDRRVAYSVAEAVKKAALASGLTP